MSSVAHNPVRGLLCLAIAATACSAAFVGSATAAAAPPGPEAWKEAPAVPVLSGAIGRRFGRDVARAGRRHLRPGVFAKVGDSNTEMNTVLYGLACRTPVYGQYRYLEPTVARYNRVKLPNPRPLAGCRPSTSFSRHSAATLGRTWSFWSVDPASRFIDPGFLAFPPECSGQKLALSCELKITRPRYTLVMTGTNDLAFDGAVDLVPGKDTGNRLARVVREIRAFGSIPVVGTLPAILGDSGGSAKLEAGISRSNRGIWRMARRHRVPLINFWGAFDRPGMINQGLNPLGLHLSVYGATEAQPDLIDPGPATYADSVNFSRRALRYGANRRNLLILQTLARLDRAAAKAGRASSPARPR